MIQLYSENVIFFMLKEFNTALIQVSMGFTEGISQSSYIFFSFIDTYFCYYVLRVLYFRMFLPPPFLTFYLLSWIFFLPCFLMFYFSCWVFLVSCSVIFYFFLWIFMVSTLFMYQLYLGIFLIHNLLICNI